MIEGYQRTIVWHVDDLKASHNHPWEVTEIAIWLSIIHGDIVKHGKQLEYLGMGFDYSQPGKVQMYVMPYINEMLRDFSQEVVRTTSTPAADHLFEVRNSKKAPKLPVEQAIAFHHNIAKLFFVSNQARLDIQTCVALITIRVKEPDDDDWGKLKQIIKYINRTTKLCLTLSTDKIDMIKWYVDA